MADKQEQVQDLERLVKEIMKAGQDYVAAKLVSDQLQEDEKNFLAELQNNIEESVKDKTSESKLERLARGSQAFRNYVTGRVTANAEMLRKKIRYESLQSLFEAKRSELSFERVKLEKGIFHEGS